MSIRAFCRLKTYRSTFMLEIQAFSSKNRRAFLQKSLKSTSACKRSEQNPTQSDLLQEDAKQQGKDLSTKLQENNQGNLLKNKMGSIQPFYPSKRVPKTAQIFEAIAANSLNEHGFVKAIEEFQKRDLKRLKLIDFMSTAMIYMEPFGVSKNVDIYNKLLDAFPKGRYQYRNVFDTLWTRYRPQIDCAIKLLTKLEENGIRPNAETYDIVHDVFGNDSIPLNKLRRIVFWFDMFDEMYPDPLPQELPLDKLSLFELAIKRMIGDEALISVYKNSNESEQHALIVGTHNSDLSLQLEECNENKPVFVEGPYPVWLRKCKMDYYILQANITPHPGTEDCILALCIIDDGGEDEVKIWISELQKTIPRLAKLNVIFNISNKL